jgi:hypothetical protein
LYQNYFSTKPKEDQKNNIFEDDIIPVGIHRQTREAIQINLWNLQISPENIAGKPGSRYRLPRESVA